MGRPEKSIDAASGPVAAFAEDLRKLRASAGNPSYRELAKIALFSPSVLSSAAAGRRLPTLQVTLAFAGACGADRAEWRRRWQALAGQVDALRPRLTGRDPRPTPTATTTGPAGVADAARSGRSLLPAQLPVTPHFVGRDVELATARALVTSSTMPRRPLVISGPVGVGKSAFAIRLAGELSAEWPDGQLYADLGGRRPVVTSPYDVVTGFLGALGVTSSQLPPEPWQRIALYRSMLADRRVLVLLDGVLDERQARPLLVRSPHSQVVVTSRSRLLGLDCANRLQLDVLARVESVAMVGAALAAADVPAEAALLDQLAELCSDLPLALDIVIRKIAARPEWPVGYTVGRLAGGGLLDRLRVGDVSVRGRLVSAYERQDLLVRAVFGRLGGSRSAHTDVAAVAAALSLPVASAEDHLETLLDAGLLRRASVPGRYRVPSLFRLFAAEQPIISLADAERAAAARARAERSDAERAAGWSAGVKSAGRRCRVESWVRRGRSARV